MFAALPKLLSQFTHLITLPYQAHFSASSVTILTMFCGWLAKGLWEASKSLTIHSTPLRSINPSCTNSGNAWSFAHLTNAILPFEAGSAQAGGGDGLSNASIACGSKALLSSEALAGSTSLKSTSLGFWMEQRCSEGCRMSGITLA